MKVSVLGPVSVTRDDMPLPLGGPKQRTVLALLIAGGGRPVSPETIIDSVWGDQAIPNARRNVQTYVATLRSILGDAIIKESYGWRLAVDDEDIDARAFEAAYEAARSAVGTHPERASVALREALALWRGHPYADIDSHGALDAEISRLGELRLAAQAARIDADLALGRDADLIGEIEALLAQHPYSERFRAQHMLALYRAGRQQESLRSYRALRTTLLDELGVEPTPDLQALELQILDQDPLLTAAPVRRVSTRAILVVDPGDPIDIGHLRSVDRAELFDALAAAVRAAAADEPGIQQLAAGATTYLVVESPQSALRIAERLARLPTGRPRLAIDVGEVVVDDGQVSGAPVSRASALAAVSHHGQVLLSAEAQGAIGSAPLGRPVRFESCGAHALSGIDGDTLVYQLLIDGQPSFPDLDTSRLPPPLPGGSGRSVPGYELREPFGPGSIGILHRAFQPTVGREVLVEVIDQSFSADHSFIRRFEADAHRLALLDHRHLAPVLDYWRSPDGAFVVYPFPRGGKLADRIGLDVDVDGIVDDLGSALAYAHSLGMVHGSLRPDRVLLDEAGNATLIGFPLAGVEAWGSLTFPAYVAPEMLGGQPPTVATDVYALAVLIHEARNGPIAPDAAPSPEEPILRQALASDPAARPDSVAELLRGLDGHRWASSADRFTPARNPYKGLTAFQELDAADFFGRVAAIDELVAHLSTSPFLAIVGPSGIGKSSLARAGLIPAIRAGRIPGSERWLVTDLIPGPQPFLALRRAIERVAVDRPTELTEALARRKPDALAEIADILPERSPLLVLIDQFEELFTMTGPDERSAFLRLLCAAAATDEVHIVVTLRADFLDQPLSFSEFGELLRTNMVTLRAPSLAELTDAIARPAEGVGVTIDQRLVQTITAEVHDQPGALPLLQHAMTELFSQRTTDVIDHAAYEASGGIEGSLARRAEAIHEGLDESQRAAVRQAFLCLVTPVPEGPPARRRVPLRDMESLEVGPAIEAFTQARMVVQDIDRETRSPTVEVAHEALLTEWPRLADWIDEAREELLLARRLDDAAQEWLAHDRDPAYLLGGGRLAQHQSWADRAGLALTGAEREFLDASLANDAAVQRHFRRRRQRVLAAFAGVAAVAVILAAVALRNTSTARRAQAEAEAEALAADAVVALDSDPTLALLLGLEAHDRSPSLAARAAIHQGLQADRQVMFIPPPDGSMGAAGAIDPTGSNVAIVGYGSSTVQLWEIGANEPTWETVLSDDPNALLPPFSHFWFSADGQRLHIPLASFEPPGEDTGDGLYTVNTTTGETLDHWKIPCLVRVTPAGGHFVDETNLLAADWNEPFPHGCGWTALSGVVEASSRTIAFQTPFGGFTPPTLSADGTKLAATGWAPTDPDSAPPRTRVFDTASGEVLLEVPGDKGILSADGERLIAGSIPSHLYEIASGNRLASYQGAFSRIGFAGDESLVTAGGPSGVVKVFDAETGAAQFALLGHLGQVRLTTTDLDHRFVVSSGFDGARVWDIASSTRGDLPGLAVNSSHEDHFYGDALRSADNRLLVRRSERPDRAGEFARPHRIEVVDLDDGRLLWTAVVQGAELGPGGLAVVQPVSQPAQDAVDAPLTFGVPRLVDAATGELVRELEGCAASWSTDGSLEPSEDCGDPTALEFPYLEFSADGRRIVGSNQLGAMAVWDTGTGRKVFQRAAAQDDVNGFFNQGTRWGASLSPDGQRLIVPPSQDYLESGGAVIEIIDLVSGAVVRELPAEQWTNFTQLDADGRLVASTEILEVFFPDDEPARSLSLPQGARIDALALSPSGRLAATVSPDGTISVWDLDTLSLVAAIPIIGDFGEGLRGVAFRDEQTILVAPDLGDHVLEFTLDPERLIEVATDHLTRALRPEECATYDIHPCPGAGGPASKEP